MNKIDIPLIIDLDGTLTDSDTLYISIRKCIKKNIFNIFVILLFLIKGKSFLKSYLSIYYLVDPKEITYNKKTLELIKFEKNKKRKIILCSASNIRQVEEIANHLNCFDKVYGSDKKNNLRGKNKLKLIIELFGEKGFDYVGNDFSDICIWKKANLAYAINITQKLRNELQKGQKEIIYLN